MYPFIKVILRELKDFVRFNTKLTRNVRYEISINFIIKQLNIYFLYSKSPQKMFYR